MFTGIIQNIGIFQEYKQGKQKLGVKTPELISGLGIGDSLSVNGVCLSLTHKEKDTLFFHLSQETLSRTNLGSLHRGDRLNLESSLTLSTPLSGHLVTGHIDSTGKVLMLQNRRTGKRITISFPSNLRPYFIPKGSVAVDGVSLTIAEIKRSSFEAELIPITLENSNLGQRKIGDRVNIECDIIGKYVYNWMSKLQE
jgi:riboflavin synthase